MPHDTRYHDLISCELAGLDELAAEYSPCSPEARAVRAMQQAIRAALPAPAPTPMTETADDIAQAREQVAARLERLAHRMRTQTSTATVAQFDRAYSAVIKLAVDCHDLLDERPSTGESPV